jgi:hypothetical protein
VGGLEARRDEPEGRFSGRERVGELAAALGDRRQAPQRQADCEAAAAVGPRTERGPRLGRRHAAIERRERERESKNKNKNKNKNNFNNNNNNNKKKPDAHTE